MATRYSTRSRRAGGSATAEPAVGGLTAPGASAPEVAARFEASEFRAWLDQLVDACSEPGRVVVVTGPSGSGKSVICEALRDEIEAPRSVVSVCAGTVNAPYAAVLTAVLGAFGFKVEPGTTVQVMAELIAHHAADATVPSRQCVVVVDDADELPMRDLHALLGLIDSTGLTLVVSGPPDLVPVIERLAQQFALDWRELRLDSLEQDDVNAYLAWREARDRLRPGRSPHPAGTAAARSGARSQGAFADILASLRAKFAAAREPAASGPPGPFGFPIRHLVILGALLVVLLLVYVVGQFAEEVATTATTTQRIETLEMPPLPAQPESDSAGSGAVPDDAAGGGDSRTVDLAVPDRTAGSDELGAAAVAPVPRPIIARPSAAVPAGQPDEVTGQPGTAPVAPARAAPPAPVAAAPAGRAADGAASSPSTPAPRPAAPAAAPAAPAQPVARAATTGTRDAGWILAQPGDAYTLQLVSLSSPERVRAYLAQQPDAGAFATYRLMRNGQLFHVVIYGSFPSKAQADQAAARLPASVGNVQPWVRQFAQVQASVRTTAQQ